MYRQGDTAFHNLFSSGENQDMMIFASEQTGSGESYARIGTFAAQDGDIMSDGLHVYKTMVTGEDIRYGEFLGSTMSVNLYNRNMSLKGLNMDRFDVYVGALSSVSPYSPPQSYKMYFQFKDSLWWSTHTVAVPNSERGGISIDGTLYFQNTNVEKIYAEMWGTWLYLFFYDKYNDVIDLAYILPGSQGQGATVYTYTDVSPGAYNAEKLKNLYANNTVHLFARDASMTQGKQSSYGYCPFSDVYEGGYRRIYEYVPLGTYKAQSRAFTMDEIVRITDTTNSASKFDQDAHDAIAALSAPVPAAFTTSFVINGLTGITVDSGVLQSKTMLKTDLQAQSYTIRSATSIALEYGGGFIAHRSPHSTTSGGLTVFSFPSSPSVVKTIPQSSISETSLEVNEYVCETPTKVRAYLPTGNEYFESGTGDNVYTIYGNPIITSQTDVDNMLTVVSKLPSYTPIEFTELRADPSVDLGDFITVQTKYGNYTVPVLSMDIYWNGVCHIDYSIPGTDNKFAKDRDSQQSYNTTVTATRLSTLGRHEDIDFTLSGGMSAGTIGTRAGQTEYSPGYTPSSVCLVYISNSAYYNPLVFISSGKVYVNWYRASASALTEANTKVTVRIFY